MAILAKSFLGFGSYECECLKVGEESLVTEVHSELKQLQDHSNEQGDELIEVNLLEEEK